MKKIIVAMVAIFTFIGGCQNSSTSSNTITPVGVVAISCADLVNEGTADDCTPAPVAGLSLFTEARAATIIDAGVISRGAIIEATINTLNDTGATWVGYFSMVFDAGCNGATTWEIAPTQPTGVIAPAESWSATIGGQCGDMALGDRILTATLYDTDPATILDTVEVHFTLVE